MELKIQDKIKYLEQLYFTNDDPIPFKDLFIHPVSVRDYYLFYSLIYCFTINKNEEQSGLGISMSHLDYALHLMEGEEGQSFANQFIALLEMIFKVKNGLFCDNLECESDVLPYSEIWKQLALIKNQEEKNIYIDQIRICEKCGKQKREVISIANKQGVKTLYIGNTEITKKDYDELRQIVCYQNIPDHDDEYIDPELKKELEEKARLENPNMVQPTLEKQMSCIASSSAYKYEELKNITIRKFVLLLRTIDAKLHYFAYRQGELSGMISFKGEIQHWIYSSDKKNKSDSVMTLDKLKDKLKDVT